MAELHDDLGDQFAAFADEVLEWAELDLAAGIEGWPDDDWTEAAPDLDG
jgi:hypothetical protein